MKHRNQKQTRLNRKVLTCALASCMFMATPQVFAQTANANLRGHASTKPRHNFEGELQSREV